MSIQWADSFSRYGTGDAARQRMLDGLVYANLGSTEEGEVTVDPDPNNPTGRAYSYGVGSTGGWNSNDFRIALPAPVSATIGMAARFWLPNLPTSSTTRPGVIQFQTVSGSQLCYILVEQNGAITAFNTSGSQIGTTTVPVVTPQAWHHYELKYNCATGDGVLYINGVLKMNITGGTTGTCSLINSSRRSGSSNGYSLWVKDLVVWDSTGSFNNDLLGTVIVGRYNPNADVTLGDWVPSTGSTGYNLLAKSTPNDTTYLIGDDTTPNPMQFNFENLPEDVTSIRAIMTVARMRKVDGGDANIQTSLSPNGTDWDDGADRPITSAFSYWFDISEASPATTAAWTPVEFDALIGEIDRTV